MWHLRDAGKGLTLGDYARYQKDTVLWCVAAGSLDILELVCTAGLTAPAAFHWHPALTVVAATVLAIESLVFVWLHAKYAEIAPIVLCGVLGLLMAFIAYGRMALKPVF
jgi:hypothetical protein